MAVSLGLNPLKRRRYRTLSLLCDDEPLSDAQLKAYQARLQEYRTFLEAVGRLALCGNVCVTEEVVTIGEHGLLTGESLNALQHAGAISVYNTLQQNNWEFPIAEDGEVAVIKTHNPIPDEFLDSEKPIRSDWPAIHISECFVDGERAKIHGSVRPLRTFLPPTVVFRNAADIDEDIPEPELNVPSASNHDGTVELVPSAKGITVKRVKKDTKEVEYIPLEEYYFGRQDGSREYAEEKGDFRFKCAVCQRIFYSNVKLMSHILGHVDELSQASLDVADVTHCQHCDIMFPSAFEYRAHMDNMHSSAYSDPTNSHLAPEIAHLTTQSASQLLLQQKDCSRTLEDAATGQLQHVIVSNVLSCRICGKETNSELALAHHLQSSHRQREMPYVCRLCLFRSSLFEDILDHFKKYHDNSNHLLCTYCLRIFTPSDARSPHYASPTGPTTLVPGVGQTQVYLQHLRMHQVRHQLRRCPTCRLNFTNKSDYQVHRRLDHKAVRDGTTDRPDETGLDSYEATDQTVRRLKETQPHITLMNAPEAGGIMDLNLLHFPENIGEMRCLECGEPMDNDAHKRYLPCSLCRFATCCAVGYNRHVNCVHVYVTGTPQAEPDSGTPMVRPIYFRWIDDEVALLDSVNLQQTPTNCVGQSAAENSDTPIDNTAEQQKEEPVPFEKIISTDQSTTVVNLQIDELLRESVQPTEKVPADTEVTTEHTDEQTADEVKQEIDRRKEIQMEVLTEEQLTDDLMESTKKDDSVQPTSGFIPPIEVENQPEIENTRDSAPHVDVQDNQLSTTPDLNEDQPKASQTDSIEITDQSQSGQPCGQQLDELRAVDRASAIVKYMASVIDARLFACNHCAASSMNGNGLARHMVEECGTSTATLNPDPLLVKARQEAEEQYRIQKAQEQQEQTETGILFESTDINLTGTELSGAVHQSERSNDDVVMMSVDGDQVGPYAFVASEDPATIGTHFMTQVGSGGTTIDVTNENGEVVQQFLIPDDLQLEEGQTLVVIQGEDGQPQLAIVNQADLIDPNNQQMVIQTEDGQTNGMLLYGSTTDGQNHLDEAVIVGQEEEKENHQYALN